LKLMGTWYFIAILTAVSLWTTLGCVSADVIVPIVITSGLARINVDHEWDLAARSVVELTREVVSNVFTGWDCGFEGLNNNCPQLMTWVMVVEVTLAMLWMSLKFIKVYCTYRWNVVLIRRVVSGLATYLLLPVASSHWEPLNLQRDAGLVFLVSLNSVFYLVDAWFYAENATEKIVPRKKRVMNVICGLLTITSLTISTTVGHADSSESSQSVLGMALGMVLFHTASTIYRNFFMASMIALSKQRMLIGSISVLIGNLFGCAFLFIVFFHNKAVSSAAHLVVLVFWIIVCPTFTIVVVYVRKEVMELAVWLNRPFYARTRKFSEHLPFRKFSEMRVPLRSDDGELSSAVVPSQRETMLEEQLRQSELKRSRQESRMMKQLDAKEKEIASLRTQLDERYSDVMSMYGQLSERQRDSSVFRDLMNELLLRIADMMTQVSQPNQPTQEKEVKQRQLFGLLTQLEEAVRGTSEGEVMSPGDPRLADADRLRQDRLRLEQRRRKTIAEDVFDPPV